jgi:hypothetical protein
LNDVVQSPPDADNTVEVAKRQSTVRLPDAEEIVLMRPCWALILAGAAFASTALAEEPRNPAPLLWERKLDAKIERVVPSADGRCLAVATDSGVTVLDNSGRELWSREYRSISPWLKPETLQFQHRSEVLAVAPHCSWIALAGDSSYRYVWIVGKHLSRSFQPKGTPEAVAVSHKGDLVAVGTASDHIYLLDPRAQLLKDVSCDLCISSGLLFSPDDALLAVTEGWGAGLYARDGRTLWRDGYWLDVNRDFQWFAATECPAHGPGACRVDLLSRDGKPGWTRALWDARARVAPDGSFIVAEGIPTNENEDKEGWEPERPMHILVLNRGGEILADRESAGCHLRFVSEDGRCIVMNEAGRLVCRDRQLHVRWEIPRCEPGCEMAASRDLRLIVEATGETVRAYGTSKEDH